MSATISSVVTTRGLTKHYGRVRALDGLDLDVGEGQIHGFLGPNGAGKSTTIRVLLGLARATSGEASVFGLDPWRDSVAIHRRIASRSRSAIAIAHRLNRSDDRTSIRSCARNTI